MSTAQRAVRGTSVHFCVGWGGFVSHFFGLGWLLADHGFELIPSSNLLSAYAMMRCSDGSDGPQADWGVNERTKF
jgi:hypothetical protein